MISFLTLFLFIVIASSWPVNKNAVIRAKLGTAPGVHKLLVKYQTGGYKFRPTIGWNGKIGLRTSRLKTKSTQA